MNDIGLMTLNLKFWTFWNSMHVRTHLKTFLCTLFYSRIYLLCTLSNLLHTSKVYYLKPSMYSMSARIHPKPTMYSMCARMRPKPSMYSMCARIHPKPSVVNTLLQNGFWNPYLSRYNLVSLSYQCLNLDTISSAINLNQHTGT